MTATIIITFCILLLVAYIFDLTSSRTNIPSVILLLVLGWVIRQITEILHIHLPDLSPILPVLGTFGLILIVLEASLELEINRSKFVIIKKSFFGALISMLALSFFFALLFWIFGDNRFKDCLTNAIPFCVISSAIAIPSVRSLSGGNKEFIIYESSFSDILGILFFNFLALNEVINIDAFKIFGLQLLIITLVSLIASIGLAFLLSKIEHHVKFIPITLLIVLIYEVLKVYHLPALIFILFFGLFIGNLDALKKYNWAEKFKIDELKLEVKRFKELIVESTFLVRVLFFLLFGYFIETSEVVNIGSFLWALLVVFLIYASRMAQLKVSKLPLKPLLFIAPRGLITILLFLSINPNQAILIVNKSLIIQIIILTALFMMYALMTHKPKEDNLN